MYTNYEYEDEKQSYEDKLNNFYGDFSTEIRNKLLTKNLVKPNNLYDVFYIKVREDLLAKNESLFKTDLDSLSEEIRKTQIARAVEKLTSIEEQSEEFRKSLLSRNKLHKSNVDLEEMFETKRKELLKSNNGTEIDLENLSESFRRNQISKNEKFDIFDNLNDKNQENFRLENTKRNNVEDSSFLEENSEFIRKEMLSKNSSEGVDVEKDSESFRQKNMSKNSAKDKELEDYSAEFRKNNISKNVSLIDDEFLDDKNKKIRESQLSKNQSTSEESFNDIQSAAYLSNVSKNQNDKYITDTISESDKYRKNNLSKNNNNDFDLLEYSEEFRKNNVVGIDSNTDLEKNSKEYREKNLSKNVVSEKNIDTISEEIRLKNIASNKKTTDFEDGSEEFRKNNLVLNTKENETDLLLDSSQFLKANLSKNTPQNSDLLSDSDSFREKALSNNNPKNVDLLDSSLSARELNLSHNKSNESDLLTDSISYREKNLSNNTAKDVDLENMSVTFRNSNLSNNIPIDSDLLIDSETARELNLSHNTINNSDLLKDSVLFRDSNLSKNVVTDIDLENISAPFRDSNLSHNVANESDLLIDSETARDSNLSHNIPNNSDLLVDSAPFRESNLSSNIPSNSDLLIDSAPFREAILSNNVPSNLNLLDISASYRESNLSNNTPTTVDLLSNSEQFRNDNMSRNGNSNQTIDNHYDQFGNLNSSENERIKNLNKNIGFGDLGFNVLGPGGTSIFIGVSGVWAQGIVFRNLLTMRNKYSLPNNAYTESRDLEYGHGGMLLSNTLNVPSMSDIDEQNALPITPSETINARVSMFPDIKSPIKRNLANAFYDYEASHERLALYYIFDNYGMVQHKIDLNLNNSQITGENFDFKKTSIQILPDTNINNLIREYLKYYSPELIDKNGKTISNNEGGQNINSISEKIISLYSSTGYGKSIIDLIESYGLFDKNRLERGMSTVSKSFTSPDEVYVRPDVANEFANKTMPGNPFDADNGFNGVNPKKGVRKILRDISNSDIKFAENYRDIQGKDGEVAKSFVIGRDSKDKSKIKRAYQKYTIRNPYAAGTASKFIFSITNYSIPLSSGNYRTMYFPPYINSFQNSESANWNSVNFLGRPEAVYTYNNSSRDGSISFFVLTDYAEEVIVGSTQDEKMDLIKENINFNFTDISTSQKAKIESLSTAQKGYKEGSLEINNNKQLNSGDNGQTDESSESSQNIQNNQQIADSLNGEIEKSSSLAYEVVYSETNKNINNVYNNTTKNDIVDGYIETKPTDSAERIKEMIKGLMFQPSYFSGNLVDFKRKVEFLSKTTRPARNSSSGSGFSFTLPPVCHIRLGDWINHDVIINSVSFDYADCPWTLIEGKNQPMWVNATINFNIVGPAGISGGVPLTSTDKEGFFGVNTIR